MLSFQCDYNNGVHPEILRRLTETNEELLPGYGDDKYSVSAKEKIKLACNKKDAEVFLTVGGTQTNKIVISSLLSAGEGVVSADTGHINCHEAGAIEETGHKVLTLSNENGKINSDKLKEYLEKFYDDEAHDHMVFPGMVYISHPTEYGTLYTKNELENISAICKEYELPLFLDGARLGYGLMSDGTDVTLEDIAEICDVFYIGGTKVGALCGEAIVFSNIKAPKRFFSVIKQSGALLAKGRLLGLQFDTLFTDNLYFRISRHAIEMADKLREIFTEKGYEFFIKTKTNQVFVILENSKMEELKKEVTFEFWERKDADHTVVRFASSWATKPEDIEKLNELL